MSVVESVPAAGWQDWVRENGATVLDIREPWEWEQGVLPGATLITMGELPERLDELDAEKPLLVVCRMGGRSQQVAMFLLMSGFARVANMSGGMKELGLQD